MAMRYYSEAFSINPEFYEVMINLSGWIIQEIDDSDGARRIMETALVLITKGQALNVLYSNLIVFYSEIMEFDKEEYYKTKYIESRGLTDEDV